MESDDGWEAQKATKVQGWNWASSRDRITKGVWMSMYPKTINGVSEVQIHNKVD